MAIILFEWVNNNHSMQTEPLQVVIEWGSPCTRKPFAYRSEEELRIWIITHLSEDSTLQVNKLFLVNTLLQMVYAFLSCIQTCIHKMKNKKYIPPSEQFQNPIDSHWIVLQKLSSCFKDVCVIFISAVVASGVIVGTLFVVVVSLISACVIMK